MGISATKISFVEEFIGAVRKDSAGWPHVWFRGEPRDVDTPLIPKVYRPRDDGTKHNENRLLQTFRMRAPVFAASSCPNREVTDQWLFLAQHMSLPTRLLDWTESALVGLYFALGYPLPLVWMLNPIELNNLSVKPEEASTGAFPLTWYGPPNIMHKHNIGFENIAGAWELDSRGTSLPVAIQPTNIHPRMSVQRSCFTVQGRDKRSLADQVPSLLKSYEIEPNERGRMRKDLRLLGISESTVWPDLDGLARELRELY